MFTRLISILKRKALTAPGEAANRPARTRERVRLGAGAAAIQKITRERVAYTNEAGVDCIIDLVRSVKYEHSTPIVGCRGMLDDPPWVRFFNERSTRFEFTDRDEAYDALLCPLMKFGWLTWDAN
jgi:hypothetical protein